MDALLMWRGPEEASQSNLAFRSEDGTEARGQSGTGFRNKSDEILTAADEFALRLQVQLFNLKM